MSRTNLSIGVCYDIHANTIGVEWNLRTTLFVLTNFLAPAYIILSVVAIASRCNRVLKQLSSHGKTSTNDSTSHSNGTTKERTARHEAMLQSTSWLSWFWVSKRCFVHFYLVGLLSTAIATKCHYHEKVRYHVDRGVFGERNLSRNVAVILLIIHIVRRAYECLCIQQYRKECSRMHVAGYALGVGHYLVLPLVFWDIGATYGSTFVGSNGDFTEKIYSFSSERFHSVTKTTTITVIVILGMISINLWLQYEQYRHHVILADIRRKEFRGKKLKDKATVEDKDILHLNRHYCLPPHQGWFRYILSPHYLAEILLYLSFAIILETAEQAAAIDNDAVCINFKNLNLFWTIIDSLLVVRRFRHLTLFVWVATNLTVSAMNSYDWYNSRYKNSIGSGHHATYSPNTSHRLLSKNLDGRKAIFPRFL